MSGRGTVGRMDEIELFPVATVTGLHQSNDPPGFVEHSVTVRVSGEEIKVPVSRDAYQRLRDDMYLGQAGTWQVVIRKIAP